MSILARFRAINDNHKKGVVRRLMEYSTPDFAFFYLVGLSVMMATLGLLEDSTSIVIGSMLIAPILYPILGLSLGLLMSHTRVILRSFTTLVKAFGIGLCVSVITALLFGNGLEGNYEIMSRVEPTVIHFMVAFVAGLAVSFALAQPEWSETLPGIAISVALVPPLAVLGIGISELSREIIAGSAVLLLMNLAGIMMAAFVSFSFMKLNDTDKENVAESTIKREEERSEETKREIEKIVQEEIV